MLPIISTVIKDGWLYPLTLQKWIEIESLETNQDLQHICYTAITDTSICKRKLMGEIAYVSYGIQIAYKNKANELLLYVPTNESKEKRAIRHSVEIERLEEGKIIGSSLIPLRFILTISFYSIGLVFVLVKHFFNKY